MRGFATLEDAYTWMTAGLDCVDNRRSADVSKPNEVALFLQARARGCCGSVDQLVMISNPDPCSDPTLYLIGCNYGH